jgi:hypothetical protein
MDKYIAKVQYTIRIKEPLLDQLKIIAQKNYRSLNNQIEYFIAKGIEQIELEDNTHTCNKLLEITHE